MKIVYRDPIGRLFDGRALPGLAKAKITLSNLNVDDDWRAAAGYYCRSLVTMMRRHPKSITTTQSITMNSVIFTREAILVMANGISSTMIICALVFTRINAELVTNKRVTRFD